MENKILIREYKAEDESEWLELISSVIVDSYAWWNAFHKKPIRDKPVIDLVACDKNRLVGFAEAEVTIDELDKEKSEVMVWNFGVHRDYRGKNIGWMMIEKLHKILNDKFGLNKSMWWTQDPDSQKYYEHKGMKEISRHWQLTIIPSKELFKNLKNQKFGCWYMRGDCAIGDIDEVKKNFNVMDDDDTMKPMVCVGYELVM